MLEFFL